MFTYLSNSNATMEVLSAIAATEESMDGRLQDILRARTKTGVGPTYDARTPAQLLDALKHARWREASHSDIAHDCRAYVTTDISGGRLGLMEIDELPEDALLLAEDPENTGNIFIAAAGVSGRPVEETFLITGKDDDGDKTIVRTFHPGEPVKLSSANAADLDIEPKYAQKGIVVSKDQAKKLGFVLVRIDRDARSKTDKCLKEGRVSSLYADMQNPQKFPAKMQMGLVRRNPFNIFRIKSPTKEAQCVAAKIEPEVLRPMLDEEAGKYVFSPVTDPEALKELLMYDSENVYYIHPDAVKKNIEDKDLMSAYTAAYLTEWDIADDRIKTERLLESYEKKEQQALTEADDRMIVHFPYPDRELFVKTMSEDLDLFKSAVNGQPEYGIPKVVFGPDDLARITRSEPRAVNYIYNAEGRINKDAVERAYVELAERLASHKEVTAITDGFMGDCVVIRQDKRKLADDLKEDIQQYLADGMAIVVYPSGNGLYGVDEYTFDINDDEAEMYLENEINALTQRETEEYIRAEEDEEERRRAREEMKEQLACQTEHVRVFIGGSILTTVASYYAQDENERPAATVTYNEDTSTITLALADGGKTDAKGLAQKLWKDGADSGKHFAISPAGMSMTKEDLVNAVAGAELAFNPGLGNAMDMKSWLRDQIGIMEKERHIKIPSGTNEMCV